MNNTIKKIVSLSCGLVLCFSSFSQSLNNFSKPDTTLGRCGLTTAFIKSLSDTAAIHAVNARRGLATTSSIITCGRFNLIFDDVTLGDGYGFNDATNGILYQQCACAVATYIQSVFQIPAGDGSQIEIEFNQSWSTAHSNPPPGPYLLAVGGGVQNSVPYQTNVPGFYGGDVYDHYTTGIDPAPGIDGIITVNFDQQFRDCSQPRNCTQYDLFSVLLHEFTHTLGWLSAVTDFPVLQSTFNTLNQFSMYDKYFSFYGPITGPLTQIVNTSGIPSINTGLPATALRSTSQLWVEGNLQFDPTNNQNFPAFCNPGYFPPGGGPPNTSSHIGDDQSIFTDQAYAAPGFTPDYVMGPMFGQNQIRDVYTPQELRALNTMGYQYTAAFLASNPYIVANRHPYTTKTIFDPNWIIPYTGAPFDIAEIDLNAYVPADQTITNCAGQTATFDLSMDASIKDADHDVIRIYPGSLYNIRGCGVGGNNHNGLTVTSAPSGDIITYTPRPNFIGRAQFGFHLYDGKEKGAYMVYTIDVNGCSPCGTNLVINGDFEEGMEIKTLANPTLPDNAAELFYRNMKYMGVYDATFPDAVIFNNSNLIYTNGASGCTPNDGQFGSYSFNPGLPNSTAVGNERYYLLRETNTYLTLCSSPQTCTRYILEFDIYTTSALTLPVGFTNAPVAQQTLLTTINPESQNIPGTAAWQHIIMPINYCSNINNCNYLVFQDPTNASFFIDNLNFYVDPNPPPLSVSISPANATICPNTNISLTANVTNPMCAVTYNWVPGNLTTSPINVAPSTTTNYVVTVNDGCRSANANVTINVFPTTPVNVTATPATICNGASSTLAVSPALSGTIWNPGSLSGNSVSVSPSTTTTYNVSGMDGNGCQATGSITVNLFPPTTLNVTATPATICNGASTTLAVSPALTGTIWNPGALSGNSVSVSPGTTTTYNVTGLDANGCTATGSTIVTVQNCVTCTNCTPLAGTISTSPAGFQTYCINNNISISGNVSFTWSEFKMNSTVVITVLPGATLNIIGSHLYSCGDMWQGIVVQPGGVLNITPFTFFGFTIATPLIEDAIVAVTINGSPLTTNILTVNSAVFNRNKTAIGIGNYTPTSTLTYPFTIQNSVFTCRDLPFTPNSIVWPQTGAVQAANNFTGGNPLISPYINNATYSPSNANAFLKNPNPGQKPMYGIYLSGVGNTVNPQTTPSYYEVQIGITGSTSNPNYNIFDNIIYDVNAINSNFTCINNIFQNAAQFGPFLNPTQGGYGIQAVANFTNKLGQNYRLQALPGATNGSYNNRFFNLAEAIISTNYFEHNIEYCDVRSSSHSNSGAPALTLATIGNYGFYISTNRYRQIEILNNSLYNVGNAITFNAIYGPYVVGSANSGNGQYSGQVDINLNTIQPNLTGYTIANQYVANAIIAQTVVSSGLLSLAGTVINVNNNSITKAYRGIYCANWQRKNVINSTNAITLATDPYMANPTQFGISHVNNIGLSNNIYDNNITGTNITNPNMHGIYTSLCHNQFLHCNTTTNTYDGLSFNGAEAATQNAANSMSNHKYGFVLNNNGVIGQQGTATSPVDDRWNGVWTSGLHYKTATLGGSSAVNGKMYVRNSGGTYNPNGSGFTTITPGITNYYYSGSTGTLLYGTGSIITCPIIPPVINPSTLRTLLEQIVLDLIPVLDNVTQTSIIAKNQVYRAIKNDTSIMTGSSVLRNFYNQSQTTTRQTFYAVDSSLVNMDVSTAQAKVSSVVPQNAIETNYQNFYGVYINYQNDSIVSTGDSTSLVTLAKGCPFTDGAVVYMARALYNAAYQNSQYFPDNCPTGSSSRLSVIDNNSLTNANGFDALIYPNPSTGKVFIAPLAISSGALQIKMTDLQGRLIYENTLSVTDGVSGFDISTINNGVYLIHITNIATGEHVVKRLTIQY